MGNVRTAKPGASSGETTIGLLQDAVTSLRNHPRDARAGLVAGRIVNFLARFPVHFVVEYLAKDTVGRVTMNRVPLSDWPDWSQQLGRDLGVVDSPVDPDSDTLVPGEPDEMNDALVAIAQRLRCECTAEAIGAALDRVLVLPIKSQDDAPTIDGGGA